MKKSLRTDMEDLRRYVEYTDQKITLPHFKKESDMEVWFLNIQSYKKL